MSVDFSDTLKQGYVKFKSKHVGNWSKRWLVLRKASSTGPPRLEKFQNEDQSTTVQPNIDKAILLSDVTDISRLNASVKKYGVELTLIGGESKSFSCDSDYEANEWIKALKTVDQFDIILNSTLMAPVDLLESVPNRTLPPEQFYVYLCPSPLLKRFGECIMSVCQDNVSLKDINDVKTTITFWPLTTIRNYGNDKTVFTIESGRRCQTGEGFFIFNTRDGSRIYRAIHSATVAKQADLLPRHPPPTRSKSVPGHAIAPKNVDTGGGRPLPAVPGAVGLEAPMSFANSEYATVDSERYPGLRGASVQSPAHKPPLKERAVPAPPQLPSRTPERPLPKVPATQTRNQSYETWDVAPGYAAGGADAAASQSDDIAAHLRRMIESSTLPDSDDEVL